MAPANGAPDTLEQHQHEVCNAFARAAVAMRDAAHTAENFSIWFSRVNNLQDVPVPPMFNGSYNFAPQFSGAEQQQQPQSSETEQTGKKRKASGDQDGKRKRIVKEKKPHDPNAPKRPPSAYLLFQNEVRKTVKSQHPDMPNNQVLVEISKLWHALTPDERAPYTQATADSKVIYEKAKADYDALSPTEAKEAGTKSTSKSKTPAAASVAVDNSPTKATTTSDDDDDEDESTSSSSDKSSDDNGEDDENEIPEPTPEPPRKKSKKEVPKAPSPPPAKVNKKKKNEEGKKKK